MNRNSNINETAIFFLGSLTLQNLMKEKKKEKKRGGGGW
jgi:hypothetical protein